MQASEAEDVPRTPEEPTPKQVLEEMNVCEPYSVGDLVEEFPDASRWTIQRRLDSLVESGHVKKKKHSGNRVTYWIGHD